MEKVKLNIVPKGKKSTCYVSQNDNGRVVRFELFNELIPYILDGSETISIKVVRPDSEEILASIENTFEGKAYIDVVFNANMTEIAGVGECELTITDGETVLGSRNFDMNIEIDAYNGKDVVIETATGVIASFNTEVEDNALEYESEIPYNAEGYTGLRVINSRTTPLVNKTPYLFRKTPDGSGNSCIEKLNGLSVAFNQLIQNGNFVDTSTWNPYHVTISSSDNVLTVTATDNSSNNRQVYKMISATVGHKYLISADMKCDKSQQIYMRFGEVDSSPNKTLAANVWDNISGIVSATTASVEYNFFIKSNNNLDAGDKYYVKNAICIDLTQMFGSTIADYLFNLEAQTVGAGVQKFKEFGFDAPYYPNNAGSLLSSKPVSKKVVGFNQFDEEMELGTINLNGELSPSTSNIRNKNYMKVLENTTYFFYNGTESSKRVVFYDKDLNLISLRDLGSLPTQFTIPNGAYYLRFAMFGAYGTTYKHDICINISDPAKDGTYEPYSEETYNLGGDELRGILKLDANNNIYADGDIKTSDGNIKRKYRIVDLSQAQENLAYSSSYEAWVLNTTTDNKGKSAGNYDTPNIFDSIGTPAIYWYGDKSNALSIGSDGQIVIGNGSTTTKPTQTIIYELATPTTESSTPFDNPQEVKVTEEFIDGRAVEIPVGHDTIYGTDIEYQDIDFDTTIFGGDINAIDGVLTSRYNSDGSVKTTPDVIELDPALIPVKAGDNNIFNSASGAQTIRYYNQED